jgi:hypothetical protein
VSSTSYRVAYVAMNAWIAAAVGSAKKAPIRPPTDPPANAAPSAMPGFRFIVCWLSLGSSR